MDMIKAAQDHINASSALQGRFFQSQDALIRGISTTTQQANQNVKDINKILNDLNEAKIPSEAGTDNEATKDVEEISKKVGLRFGQVESQVNSLKNLENVNYELIKARSLESITLRAHQSYRLQLPDLKSLDADPNAQSHLLVIFSVNGLGKHFKLFWKWKRALMK
jgi:hypothetical protein